MGQYIYIVKSAKVLVSYGELIAVSVITASTMLVVERKKQMQLLSTFHKQCLI